MLLNTRFLNVLYLLLLLTSCSEKKPIEPPTDLSDVSNTDIRDDRPLNFLIIHVDDVDFDELGVYWRHKDPAVSQLPSHTRAEQLDLYHVGSRGQTLGYSHVGPMDTPNIDQLAEEGMLFTRFYVTSPVCTPSRFSLMTGRYASRSIALREETPVGEPPLIAFNTPLENEVMFPQALQQAGYVTGMVGKWHNFGSEGSYRGNGRLGNFRDADPRDPVIAEAITRAHDSRKDELITGAGFDYVGALYPGNVEELGIPRTLFREARHNVEWITEAARGFLTRHNDEPFMLYVAHTAPHGWMGDIGNDEQKVLTPRGVLDQAPQTDMLARSEIYAEVRSARRGRPMARWLDDGIGDLLATLDRLGIADHTVVILISDHGNRGKESVYEAARSPMLVRWPGVIEPRSVNHELVANIDIAPTILSLANADANYEADGLDMAPLWQGSAEKIRDALMLEMSLSRAIVKKDYKYIANRPPEEVLARMREEASMPLVERLHGWDGNWRRNKDGKWRDSRRISYLNQMFFPSYFDLDQLYDLEEDNMEQVNLVDNQSHQDQLEMMQRLLAEFLAETNQPVDWYFPDAGHAN